MLSRDEDILKAAEDWRKDGRGVALATVVETWGSAPRPVGSNLVIDEEGNFLGSVSGGCVEGAVVDRSDRRDRRAASRKCWNSASPTRPPGRSDFPAAAPSASMWRRSVERSTSCMRSTPNAPRGARWSLVTDVASGAQRLVKAADVAQDPLREAIEKRLRMGKSGMEETPQGRVFLTVHVPSPQLVITGAVHISQALAPIGQLLGYDVTIVDPRTAFASHRALSRREGDRRMAGRGAAAAQCRPLHRLRRAHARSEDRRSGAAARADARLLLYRRARLAEDACQARSSG